MRKIRFAPGKGNQKLIAMYNDGAEVWDTKEVGPALQSAVKPGKLSLWELVLFSTFSENGIFNKYVQPLIRNYLLEK